MRRAAMNKFCRSVKCSIPAQCQFLAIRWLLALLATQIIVYAIFVIRISPQKRITNNIRMIRYLNQSETELYINGDLNITETNDDDECVKTFLNSYSEYCEKAIFPSLKVLKQYYDSAGDWLNKDPCPCLPENLTGKVDLNMSSVKLSAEIFNGLRPGGHWAPSWCIPRQRIAIIIPFRDRASHLDIFLQVFHPFLQKQLHSYSIFVIEQKDPKIFNKAAMMNIGFVEITRRASDRVFDCFIFHDVDTLPQDDRNIYGCYRVPRHVAAYLDKYNYRLKYYKMFGGATAFTKRQFELSNGYSNEFWGWGGEDDDMEKRSRHASLRRVRLFRCPAVRLSPRPVGRRLAAERVVDVRVLLPWLPAGVLHLPQRRLQLQLRQMLLLHGRRWRRCKQRRHHRPFAVSNGQPTAGKTINKQVTHHCNVKPSKGVFKIIMEFHDPDDNTV